MKPGSSDISGALKEIEERLRELRAHEERVAEVRNIRSFDEAYHLGRANKRMPPPKRRIAVEAFRQAFRLDRGEARRADRTRRRPPHAARAR